MITFETPEKMVEILSNGITDKYSSTLKLNIYNYCAEQLSKDNASLEEEIKKLQQSLKDTQDGTNTIEQNIESLTQNINNMTEKLTTLENTVNTVNTNLTSLTERVSTLESTGGSE